ncbi:MAG TPA: fibronectin type III domain-containing protein, partial [Gemmataceae bacterium]|nr:fibronectin type III domain-containing protein [Gemmataceae bacterium]
ENYLNNTSIWTYDLATNTWRDMRPAPAPRVAPLRCAAWDSEYQVAVVFGGEGSQEGTLVYDPYTNTWTRMRPAKQPAPRSAGNMAYDAARKLHILFGSQFTDDPHTWAYDLARNEWRDMKPAVQPPTDRNDAVLAYDAAQRVVVAVVRVWDRQTEDKLLGSRLETWTYDAGTNTWKRMRPPREPDGSGNRRRIMVAVPDQQMVLMEAYINPTERVPGVDREQQIWTYRAGPVKPVMTQPPAGLTVTTQPGGNAVLKWTAAPGAKAYQIHRGEGASPWTAQFKVVAKLGGKETTWQDRDLLRGNVYHYQVRALPDKDGEWSDAATGRTQPRIVEDAVASVLSAREVQVTWRPPSGSDIVGYHVERAPVEVFTEDEVVRLKKDTPPLAEPSAGTIRSIGAFVRLTREPLKEAAYTDRALDLTKPQAIQGEPVWKHGFRRDQLDEKGKEYRYGVYAYRIRAVNALGTESGPSPYVLTIPSAPQWLFAREDGASCHLRWAANPDKGVKGYRVYRMESPRINGPGQKVTRLTADPVAELRYTDAGIGKDTRRYWVVAVDALGQEGLPSAPAWHYRQYRKYYQPFVGEWHQ